MNTFDGGQLAISVTPPESLVRYNAPLFVGIEPSPEAVLTAKGLTGESSTKLDDMINSMLPPR